LFIILAKANIRKLKHDAFRETSLQGKFTKAQEAVDY